jgi:hypothetical protein
MTMERRVTVDVTERGIAETWARMRAAMRAHGFHISDGDGSIRAIAECAHGLAGVAYTAATLAAAPDRALLTAAGALGMLATAARLIVATRGAEADAAARAAVLAGDIFDACAAELPSISSTKPTEPTGAGQRAR